ncbi:MAG TPA: glutathione S-transferase family protein [Kofleriaceae bacterium]|nr:glutathione S-transferase family protein [Kofleriaceae bacterium]
MTQLLGLPYSPWTERARWALDVRGVAYEKRLYSPLLGEPGLRRKLGKWRGVVSVPVLTDDDGTVVADSIAIARWANERGAGTDLFPSELDAEIGKLIALADRGLAAGRALSLIRLLRDDEGLLEMVPRSLRKMPGARAISAAGIRRTLRKYDGLRDEEAARSALAGVLDEVRAALAGRPTLLGRFTYADIAVAQVLAFVEPPAFGLKIGAGTRRSFCDDVLSERYRDLVVWRDALYEAHRPRT